jgi:hypothetical protein
MDRQTDINAGPMVGPSFHQINLLKDVRLSIHPATTGSTDPINSVNLTTTTRRVKMNGRKEIITTPSIIMETLASLD